MTSDEPITKSDAPVPPSGGAATGRARRSRRGGRGRRTRSRAAQGESPSPPTGTSSEAAAEPTTAPRPAEARPAPTALPRLTQATEKLERIRTELEAVLDQIYEALHLLEQAAHDQRATEAELARLQKALRALRHD